jgi:hypothetical protein
LLGRCFLRFQKMGDWTELVQTNTSQFIHLFTVETRYVGTVFPRSWSGLS